MEKANRKYYAINEKTACDANMINSFNEYKKGSATETYKYYCDKVYDILDRIKEQKPQLVEKAETMTDRYCRKLAEYYNDYYRNEASCPSIMISGRGNFPVNKKEKQNRKRETLMNMWDDLKSYKSKIELLLTREMPILVGETNEIERLEKKIEQLEKEHKNKMYWNKYYKQHGTLRGCENLTNMQIENIELFVKRNPFFSPFGVENDTSNIRRYKQRLEKLKKVKERGKIEETITDIEENVFFKIVENTEIMRLQLFFERKPNEEIRTVLKSNGFKWSPSQGAWQRQLTDNAKYSLKRVKEVLIP